MPTFITVKDGKKADDAETIRGADASRLRAAIEAAKKKALEAHALKTSAAAEAPAAEAPAAEVPAASS